MKIDQGRKLIQPFISECEKVKEPYLVVHFSKTENHFEGTHDFMDSLDAMIVIKNLVKEFQIPETLLMTAV